MAEPRTDADAIIELTRSATAQRVALAPELHLHDLILPPGHTYVPVDLESKQDHPRRKRGHVELHTSDALVAYIGRHLHGEGIESPATIYAHADHGEFVALLNDSTAGQPGWGDHRAELALRKTEGWKRWATRDGLMGSQGDFAQHIEDGLAEIVDPSGADMLELAQTFQAHTTVRFKQALYLDNGQRSLQYEESIEAQAGRSGSITIPKQFRLVLAPYDGTEEVEVLARLRHRISNGSLSIGYKLVRPIEVERAAFDATLEQIASQLVHVQVFRGSPPERG